MKGGGAILLLLVLGSAAGGAGAAHITDKLAVGLYRDPTDAKPARVLITGTPLEILERQEKFCKVRLGDGDSGWLECRYATDEKPARAMLVEAQARNGKLWDQVNDLKSQLEKKQLRVQALELRLQAAERVVEQGGGSMAAQSGPDVAQKTNSGNGMGSADGTKWSLEELLPLLLGLAGGLLLGALLLWWRCRRRYGGLRI